MMLTRQCIAANKRTPRGTIFDLSDYLNGFLTDTPMNSGVVHDDADKGFAILTEEIPRLSAGVNSATTERSSLIDQATVLTNDLLVNSIGNTPVTSEESEDQQVVAVHGRDGKKMLFYN